MPILCNFFYFFEQKYDFYGISREWNHSKITCHGKYSIQVFETVSYHNNIRNWFRQKLCRKNIRCICWTIFSQFYLSVGYKLDGGRNCSSNYCNGLSVIPYNKQLTWYQCRLHASHITFLVWHYAVLLKEYLKKYWFYPFH